MLQEFHLALGICRSFDVGGLNAIVRQVAPPKQSQLVRFQIYRSIGHFVAFFVIDDWTNLESGLYQDRMWDASVILIFSATGSTCLSPMPRSWLKSSSNQYSGMAFASLLLGMEAEAESMSLRRIVMI